MYGHILPLPIYVCYSLGHRRLPRDALEWAFRKSLRTFETYLSAHCGKYEYILGSSQIWGLVKKKSIESLWGAFEESTTLLVPHKRTNSSSVLQDGKHLKMPVKMRPVLSLKDRIKRSISCRETVSSGEDLSMLLTCRSWDATRTVD